MRIPKSFRLAGHEISVEIKDLTPDEGDHDFGESCFETDTIGLDKGNTTIQMGDAFWHEFVEQINGLWELGLSHQTIQALGLGLHQGVTTAKFEEKMSEKNKQQMELARLRFCVMRKEEELRITRRDLRAARADVEMLIEKLGEEKAKRWSGNAT